MASETNARSSLLFEIAPTRGSRNSHRSLGITAALFALLLSTFILWNIVTGLIGTWTIIFLVLVVLLFAVVSWFVLRFGKDYVTGIHIYVDGLAAFYPLVKDPERREKFIPFSEVERIEISENLEVHRTGRRIRKFDVYRLSVWRKGAKEPELLADMVDLAPGQVLAFRKIPGLLEQNRLLQPDQIDRSKMPAI